MLVLNGVVTNMLFSLSHREREKYV